MGNDYEVRIGWYGGLMGSMGGAIGNIIEYSPAGLGQMQYQIGQQQHATNSPQQLQNIFEQSQSIVQEKK